MDQSRKDFYWLISGSAIALATLFYLTVPGLAHAGAATDLYAGGNGIWAKDDVYPTDFEIGANGSASLSPHLAAVAAAFYGFGHSYLRGSGGFRLTATDPNDPNFSIGLGLQYHVSSEENVRPQEFAVDASIGYRPWPVEQPKLLVIAQGQYGLDKGDAEVIAGLRYRIGGSK